jgi:membrane protease YdiL (CAAX protease family)
MTERSEEEAASTSEENEVAADEDGLDGEAWSSAKKPDKSDGKSPLGRAVLVVLVVAVGMTLALQPGFRASHVPWFVMCGVYLGLAAYALVDLGRRGLLADRLRIRPGDASVGIVVGLALCAAGAVAQRFLLASGADGARWLADVQGFGGDFQTNGLLIFVLFVICVCEETVWRGMVQDQLTRFHSRAAPALTALAYATSTVPSVFLLGHGKPNPLMLLAALGCGLVWSYARRAVPRLFPLIVSHLVFTYFMAAPLPVWIVPD